jgi:hypothetical protein
MSTQVIANRCRCILFFRNGISVVSPQNNRYVSSALSYLPGDANTLLQTREHPAYMPLFCQIYLNNFKMYYLALYDSFSLRYR